MLPNERDPQNGIAPRRDGGPPSITVDVRTPTIAVSAGPAPTSDLRLTTHDDRLALVAGTDDPHADVFVRLSPTFAKHLADRLHRAATLLTTSDESLDADLDLLTHREGPTDD